jgi:uncharacterized DUF497 family protein
VRVCATILEKDRTDETGEQRWHAIGRVGGAAIYIVFHVDRGERWRRNYPDRLGEGR